MTHAIEVKYCALQEHIIKMQRTSSISGVWPCNQDNKMGKDERHDVPGGRGGGRRQEEEVGHPSMVPTAGLIADQFWTGRG